MGKKQESRRYTLVIPEELYAELQAIAQRDNVAVVDVLRKFIKLGLIADKVAQSGDAKLLIRENGVDRELVFI